jgi:hypothetical protein
MLTTIEVVERWNKVEFSEVTSLLWRNYETNRVSILLKDVEGSSSIEIFFDPTGRSGPHVLMGVICNDGAGYSLIENDGGSLGGDEYSEFEYRPSEFSDVVQLLRNWGYQFRCDPLGDKDIQEKLLEPLKEQFEEYIEFSEKPATTDDEVAKNLVILFMQLKGNKEGQDRVRDELKKRGAEHLLDTPITTLFPKE